MIVTISTLAAALPPLADAQQNPLMPTDAQIARDLPYVDSADPRQTLDLYLPSQGNGPFPVIVWVHGGAWLGGSKVSPPSAGFVVKGYALASINYRLSQQATFPAQIHDVKAAVRWLRAHAQKYNLDPDRFAAWGNSAGGHLVALLGTSGDVKELEGVLGHNDQSSRVQAVVDFFGPTDLLQMDKQAGPMSKINHDAPDSPESRLIGGPIQENKEKAAQANPITYISKDDPPFLIVHGDSDDVVPLGQSKLLHEALQQAGIESTLHVVRGGGHGRGIFRPDVGELVEKFLEKHLKHKPQPAK